MATHSNDATYYTFPEVKEEEVVKTGNVRQLNLRKRGVTDVSEQPKKKKCFVKRFRKEWLDEPLFEGWLQPVPDQPDRSYCKVCDVVLLAGKSELEKHASGKKHCDMIQVTTPCIEDSYQLVGPDREPLDSNQQFEMLTTVSYDDISSGNVVYEVSDGRILTLDVSNLSRKTTPVARRPINAANPTSAVVDVKPSVMPSILKRPKLTTSSPAKLVTARPAHPALPSSPDPQKLMHCIDSDSEEDDLLDEMDDPSQLIREMRAELAYGEKKIIDQKLRSAEDSFNGKFRDNEDDTQRQIAEKELEARLSFIEEKRRHSANIYKLKIAEMETKIRLAETELRNARELHDLRKVQIKRQIGLDKNCVDSG